MKKIFQNKKFLSVYLIWVLVHTFLLLQGKHSEGYERDFWPFSSTELGAYDISEWAVYVFSPLVIVFFVIAFNKKTTKIILILICLHSSLIAQVVKSFNQPPPSPGTLDMSPDAALLPANVPIPAPMPNIDAMTIPMDKSNLSTAPIHHRKIKDIPLDFSTSEDTKKDMQKADQKDWDKFANQPASQQTQMQPEHFDWNKCNADRFVNSPCYQELGFHPYDPETESLQYQRQEHYYAECENEKSIETVKHIAIIGFTVISVIAIIVFGVKQVKKQNLTA